MRRRLVALVLVALAPVSAWAQNAPPPLFGAADATDVRGVIDRYFTAFSAKDYAVFREVFNAPYLVVPGGRMTTIATLDEVAQRYEGIRNALDQVDYSASKAANVRLVPLHGGSVLAQVHWQRLKKDGSVLNEGAEVMMLTRIDGRWKITGNLPQDLRQFQAQ